MKRYLYTALIAAPLATAVTVAQAGGLAEPVATPTITPAPAPVPVASTGGDWTGFYAGAALGYADISEDDPAVFDNADVTYGGFVGYDYDFGSFVLGAELELSGFENSDNGVDVEAVARGKLRAGYDAGAALPYVTVGYAYLDTEGAFNGSDDGVLYGAGVDYALTDQITIGGEVLQHDFNDFDGSGLDFDATTISARVGYRF